jgi:DUF4097 and DUF4098 domain-containing protein YvlB
MKALAWWVPAGALLLVSAGCDFEDFGGVNMQKEAFEKSFPMQPGGRLTVENFNGSIEVAAWDENSVRISGTKFAPTQQLLGAIRIDMTAGGDSLRVRTVRPIERRGNMGASYVIRVPRKTELERLESSNGSIRVEDVEGGARLKTSNGSVRMTGLKGSVEAQTSNGSIELNGHGGAAVLQTSNGSVRADGVRGQFQATTSNGRITARLVESDPARPVKVSSSNGSIDLTIEKLGGGGVSAQTSNSSITLRLPAKAGARVQVRTSNSSVQSDFDVTGGRVSKGRLEGEFGGGGPVIDLVSSNGPIRLMRLP